MATKTTGGSMYSGLLQTNQELAKAKAEASAGVGKGLAEGFKPLQGYLMGVAAKEQKRLDQLDSDMGIAGGYLGKMTDTAGILGEFEQEITDFGVTTKNLLNDIAKDESLNQFEKQAKYVEAVNAFNKRVSLYSGDQEIIAGLSGRFANGTISKANNLEGDDYLIGRALATGNFTVKNGQYSIFDDNKQQIKVTGAIDSNRIKNLYVTDTKYDFDKISAGYAKIGAASKTEEELQNNIRQVALGFGTKESALAQLVEGEYHEYEAIKDNTLQQLQDLIYDAGYNTAKQTFIKAKPKEKLLGTAEQMGMRMMGVYDSAINSKNYNAFLGMELGGATVTSFDINETNPNKIQFYRTDPKGRLVTIAEELDLITDKNTIITAITMGSDGTDTQKNEALNFVSRYKPLVKEENKKVVSNGEDPIVDNTNKGLPERITNLSNEPFIKDNREEYLKEKGLESIDELPSLSKPTILRSIQTPEYKKAVEKYNTYNPAVRAPGIPKEMLGWLKENKEGVFSERNLAEAYYQTRGKTEEEKATAIESEKNALVQKAQEAILSVSVDKDNNPINRKLSGDAKSKAMSQRKEIKKALDEFTEGDTNNKFKYIDMSELTEQQYEIFKYIKQGVDVERLRKLLKYAQ